MKPAVVGDGCTISVGSDRYAYTVIEVSASGNRAKVQSDTAKLVGGEIMSESQKYEYTPNPNGKVVEIYRNSRGAWREKGAGRRGSGIFVYLGVRREYRDPSF
jgi:hypothetical protein